MQFITALFGFFTTAIISFMLGWLEVKSGLAIYSFTFWFVIPAGAMIAGAAAASGYYIGAKFLHIKPYGGMLLNMVLASISAFFLVHYTIYQLVELDGLSVKAVIGFKEFLQLYTQEVSLQFRGSSSFDLSEGWSFLYNGLLVIGFGIGGIWPFALLKEMPYCRGCSKYYTQNKRNNSFSGNGEDFINSINDLSKIMYTSHLDDVFNYHGSILSQSYDPKLHHLKSELTDYVCPSCCNHHLRHIAFTMKGDDWSKLGLGLAYYIDYNSDGERFTK